MGSAMTVVLIHTQIKTNIGIPTKMERKPRNGCFQRNRSAFKSNSRSNFRMDFVILIVASSLHNQNTARKIKKGKGYGR